MNFPKCLLLAGSVTLFAIGSSAGWGEAGSVSTGTAATEVDPNPKPVFAAPAPPVPVTPTGQISYATTWLGNTFGGVNREAIQTHISAMALAPDGTVFPITGWEEDGKGAQILKEGKPGMNPGSINGWGYYGGDAIALNKDYIYYAQNIKFIGQNDASSWPPEGKYWVGLTRRRRSDPREGAPFEGAKGGASGTQRMFLLVHELPWKGEEGSLTGMAADDQHLYVSDPFSTPQRIRVYDARTMTFRRSFEVDRPGPLALDRQNTLWVVQQGATAADPARILHYSVEGKRLPGTITDVVQPAALAIDNEGRLMVAEAGPRQQILFFSTQNFNPQGAPALVKTFGERGGIYSGIRGRVGDLKFNSPNAVGMDAQGNLYVNSRGSGTDLRKFSPSGRLLWKAVSTTFLDVVAADPGSDGRHLYSRSERYEMDYRKRAGGEWTHAAHTLDRFRYPNDPRLTEAFQRSHQAVQSVQWIGGKKFLFLTNQAGTYTLIYRFRGEIAVPSVIFSNNPIPGWAAPQPSRGRFIWRDKNGDGDFQAGEFDTDGRSGEYTSGREVDRDGNLWTVQGFRDPLSNEPGPFERYLVQGLDSHGNPIYTFSKKESYPTPPLFVTLERVKYVADTDTLYLSGYTYDRKGHDDKHGIAPHRGRAGTELVRYDGWIRGNRTLRWRISLPYANIGNNGGIPRVINALDIAGQRIFAGFLGGVTGEKEYVLVYDTETGQKLGSLLPGPEIGGNANWVDMAYGVRAFQRANGEYVVSVEDVVLGKTILYRGTMMPK
ncbi:MAG: hypothetical protein KY468_03770 [Armatimonadetes bacterium]|nr:hypothetical protein [Armatimonadota bacterium]